ncbi:MAG: hypothetical protein HGA49_05065 [Eubacteriaceae bacterium]|nr:hypothetical protein [Eubacteriaceae bacterium]
MKIAALTGAGISKASGVPTFTEMGDLRSKLSRMYFQNHPEDFYFVLTAMKKRVDKSLPNPAHYALSKYNIPIVTMNIDGLHHLAGSKEDDVIEIHGSLRKVHCHSCSSAYDFSITSETIYCPKCKDSLLQPDVVLYGDSIPKLGDAIHMVSKIDLLLIIGTSFVTSTANYIKDCAEEMGSDIFIINDNSQEEVPGILKTLLEGDED